MVKKKKIDWKFGDVFLVPLKNGNYATGQILDLQMTNVVRVALYDEPINDLQQLDVNSSCSPDNLISMVACSREQLDFGVWKIVGNKPIKILNKDYPNEQFKRKNWVGAIIYDAALLEDFFNSFYSLLPWDDWFNPNYLDQFLISLDKKPKKLLYKNRPPYPE